jgi:hypothetical protein
MIGFDQPREMFWLVERLASIGVAVSSLELLRYSRPLRPEGIMSWEVARLRHRLFVTPRLENFLNGIFSYGPTLGLIALRLLAAIVLLTGAAHGSFAALLAALIALSGIAFSLRCPFGLDGADQLYTLIFSGLALARIVEGEMAQRIFLGWLAAHVAIAYLTSGVAKLFSKSWRSGTAIPGVFGTIMYGLPALGRWLKPRDRLCQFIAGSIILGEIALPFCLVTPLPVAFGLLACGVCFHLLAALTMGLNSFLWAFVATYPALLYAGSVLTRLFGVD